MTESCGQIYDAWDAEFARNRELHGGRIRCGPGCSDCCRQLFQITEPEAAVISRGMNDLEPELATRLRERAQTYLTARADLYPAEAWGSLPPAGARVACPALDLGSGTCQIYPFRPLICRKYGVPIWNPDRPGRVYACELNFAAGEAIDDGALVQIQTSLHSRWKRLQSEYNEAGGFRQDEPMTIARAILGEPNALS